METQSLDAASTRREGEFPVVIQEGLCAGNRAHRHTVPTVTGEKRGCISQSLYLPVSALLCIGSVGLLEGGV